MVTQCVSLLVCEQAHTPVQVSTAREVEKGEGKLLFRVHFHVYSAGESVLNSWNLAYTHVHLLLLDFVWAAGGKTESLLEEALFLQLGHKNLKHARD